MLRYTLVTYAGFTHLVDSAHELRHSLRRLRRTRLRVRRQLRSHRPRRPTSPMPMKSRYADHPGHPLEHVPQEALDLARTVLADAAQWRDVDPELADPIADAVVARLAEAGYLATPTGASVRRVLDQMPAGLSVSADLAIAAGEPPSGTVLVPNGTARELIQQLADRLGPSINVREQPLGSERRRWLSWRSW